MSYHHLTTTDRCHIYELNVECLSVTEIAERTGRSKSTISRELIRNRGERGYRAAQAERFARERQQNCANGRRIDPRLWEQVVVKLREEWSPENISGRFEREGVGQISTATIYARVREDKAEGGDLYTHLRCQKKRRRAYGTGSAKRTRIPNRVGIEDRPAVVDRKLRIGDWEGDLIIGKNNHQAIVSLVERKSRLALLYKVSGKSQEEVTAAIIERLKEVEGSVKTITFDNGLEFSGHAKIAATTGAKIYFAWPYHSWERGLNEQTTGLVRQYFPKGSCFQHLTEADMHRVEQKLNKRPRKVLDYQTPNEIWAKSYIKRAVALRVGIRALCGRLFSEVPPQPRANGANPTKSRRQRTPRASGLAGAKIAVREEELLTRLKIGSRNIGQDWGHRRPSVKIFLVAPTRQGI